MKNSRSYLIFIQETRALECSLYISLFNEFQNYSSLFLSFSLLNPLKKIPKEYKPFTFGIRAVRFFTSCCLSLPIFFFLSFFWVPWPKGPACIIFWILSRNAKMLLPSNTLLTIMFGFSSGSLQICSRQF
jgi:hypothetical protein